MLVSVVLTAHNEGIIAHKTILSLKNNLKILDQENISYEVIIHIDNGTKETNNYFSRFSREKNFKIVKNQFGDLGKSRNYAISIAQGKYIATLDADDLISPNYLADSVRLLENSALMCVAHPEYCLSFRTDNNYTVLWQMHNSADSKAIDGYNLLDNNRWISAAVARREVFLKYPYKERINGYGHEDYIFNINTISDNIPHVVIKDSVYFYRQKNSSLNISSNQSNVTEPYSALFDFSSIKKASEAEVSRTHKTLRTRFIEKYIKLRNNKLANTIISPVAYMGKRLTGKRITASGQWRPSARVIDSWRTISKIETALYPTSKRLSNIDVYDPDPNHDIGTAYKNIAKNTNADKVDYIFIAPWLRTGGADKVIINYLKAFNELFPKRKIALITTVPGQNEWSDRLPKNTQLIDFGNESRKLNNYQKERLFTKIIVQLRSKYIHIINSEYGYLWAESHKELIRGNFILNLSLFCYDIIPGTNGDGRFDYADPYAVNVYDITRKIFTDNSKLADSLSALNGFDSSKFVLEYQPIDVMEKPKPKTWGDDKRHILWAGRICA